MSDIESVVKALKFRRDQLEKLKEKSAKYADSLENAGQLLRAGKLSVGTFPPDAITTGKGELAPYPSMQELIGLLQEYRGLEGSISRLEGQIPEHMRGL
ncbi:MAG: hypothetical protein OXH85_02450 [Truepera sp.]|nr:hypothetical protein [Truepera sp.]